MKVKNSKFRKFFELFDEKPFLSSFIVILLFFSVYIIAFYPIVLSPDPSNQILQYYNVRTKYGIEFVKELEHASDVAMDALAKIMEKL